MTVQPDEDLDLSHLFLARSAQPTDDATDVPYFPDDDEGDGRDRPGWWDETVLVDALAGWP